MKHLYPYLVVLFALLCVNCPLKAAPNVTVSDTLNLYVIDHQHVDQFDGSQLVGKKIVDYQIMTAMSEKDVIRVHEILTENALQPNDPAFVIDGQQVPKEEFEKLTASDIESITVIKNGSREDVKQYAGWENGVVLVETKKDRSGKSSQVKSEPIKIISVQTEKKK